MVQIKYEEAQHSMLNLFYNFVKPFLRTIILYILITENYSIKF